MYFPGRYVSEVKRPGNRYILRGILLEDFALWVLSSIFISTHPLVLLIGLIALLVSFWSVYERGYMDNDFVAATSEEKPVLSPTFQLSKVTGWMWQPWLWALAFGALGTYLVSSPGSFDVKLAIWIALLVFTHTCFWVYNRLDKGTRVWMFAVLQLLRSCAFALVVPVHPMAAMAIGAHVISKWIPYYVYRLPNMDKWSATTMFVVRLLFFIVFTAIVAVVDAGAAVFNVTTAALALWFIVRARRELTALYQGMHAVRQQIPRKQT
jgi:hypothetical protein